MVLNVINRVIYSKRTAGMNALLAEASRTVVLTFGFAAEITAKGCAGVPLCSAAPAAGNGSFFFCRKLFRLVLVFDLLYHGVLFEGEY
jgi:hypothetical protein